MNTECQSTHGFIAASKPYSNIVFIYAVRNKTGIISHYKPSSQIYPADISNNLLVVMVFFFLCTIIV